MREILNGYLLEGDFQSKNAGFSKWTFAEKNGRKYFIKEFIDPVYPKGDSISAKMKAIRIAECEAEEKKKARLYETINRVSDGNVVRIEEFFRVDSHYYITMRKIEEDRISFETLQKYSMRERLILCLLLAHAMARLHEAGIIHSDIKENNVLIHLSKTGQPVPKVIDFDCGFFEGEEPETGESLGGDQVYLSPEGCLFLCDEEAELTCKMDVFSMGLLFHQYLTGSLPGFDSNDYDYAHEAVLDGQELKIADGLPEYVCYILQNMLTANPEERMSSRAVYVVLGRFLYGTSEADTSAKVGALTPNRYGSGAAKESVPAEQVSGGNGWFYNPGSLGR